VSAVTKPLRLAFQAQSRSVRRFDRRVGLDACVAMRPPIVKPELSDMLRPHCSLALIHGLTEWFWPLALGRSRAQLSVVVQFESHLRKALIIQAMPSIKYPTMRNRIGAETKPIIIEPVISVARSLANWSGPILFKAIRYKHIGIMIGAIIAQINANLLAPLDCTLIRKKGFFIGHLVI